MWWRATQTMGPCAKHAIVGPHRTWRKHTDEERTVPQSPSA